MLQNAESNYGCEPLKGCKTNLITTKLFQVKETTGRRWNAKCQNTPHRASRCVADVHMPRSVSWTALQNALQSEKAETHCSWHVLTSVWFSMRKTAKDAEKSGRKRMLKKQMNSHKRPRRPGDKNMSCRVSQVELAKQTPLALRLQ